MKVLREVVRLGSRTRRSATNTTRSSTSYARAGKSGPSLAKRHRQSRSTDGQGAEIGRRLGALEDRRALWNSEAQARLAAAGEDVLPAAVLTHALRSRWIPRTFRAAVDGYWRAHPLRRERLARGLASRSGTPAGWRWRLGPLDDLPASYRTPPLPFREPRSPALVSVSSAASQSSGLAGTESGKAPAPNQRAAWHACCVVAWKVWTHPNDYRAILSRLQNRKCAVGVQASELPRSTIAFLSSAPGPTTANALARSAGVLGSSEPPSDQP